MEARPSLQTPINRGEDLLASIGKFAGVRTESVEQAFAVLASPVAFLSSNPIHRESPWVTSLQERLISFGLRRQPWLDFD
jgi:hypothetical protein